MIQDLDQKKEQRQKQNRRSREQARKRQEQGLCRCGKKAAKDLKMCPTCLLKARKFSRDLYRLKHGIPQGAPLKRQGRKTTVKERISRDCGVKMVKGVTRQTNKDGYGRESDWYVASIQVQGKPRSRRWSVDKYGEDGARLAASLQRMLWIIEEGCWKPEDGDPLALLSDTQSFEGNRDYQDCVIDHQPTLWSQAYED